MPEGSSRKLLRGQGIKSNLARPQISRSPGGLSVRPAPARRHRCVEVEAFFDGTDPHAIHLWAEIRRVAAVFGIEDRLPGVDERRQSIAFVVFIALLIERPIKIVEQIKDLVDIVF